LAAGESLTADKVVLPAGIKLISDPKMTVVHLSVRSAEVEEVAVVAAPVEGAAPAEGAAPVEGAAAKDDKK
jgi:large subunit ribosomal protein L25